MNGFKIKTFPKTRIATKDICAIGVQKHYVAAFVELDVSANLQRMIESKRSGNNISFLPWLIKIISTTVREHEHVAAFLIGKQQVVIFNNVQVSLLVEKEVNGVKVPIPLIIDNASEQRIDAITEQIDKARNQPMTKEDIVLHNKSTKLERIYFSLPGFIRRAFWRFLLQHPHIAYKKMGNVGITSIGTKGGLSGWFIPISIHPICFGIGSITKKPVVVDDAIVIREMLPMTVLMDHDVIDGRSMAQFLQKLADNIVKDGLGNVDN